MLTRPSEPIESALERLSPVDRALLELSTRSGISDTEIAEVLRVDAAEVQDRRRGALAKVAEYLEGDSGHELAGMVESEAPEGKAATANGSPSPANGTGSAPAAGKGVSDPPLDQEAARAGAATIEVKPSPRFELPRLGGPRFELPHIELPEGLLEGRRRFAIVAAGLACLVLIVGLLVAGGGDEGSKAPAGKRAKPASPSAGLKAAMLPVGGDTGATGSVQLRGSTLSIRAEQLPRSPAPYTVWVYDSVTNAVPVGSLKGPNDSLEARMPKGFERYDFIDVSREPADGNPNHSGASVVRAPLKPLLASR
jgi:hypothetical protein